MQELLKTILGQAVLPNQCISCHTLSEYNLCGNCITHIPDTPNLWINNNKPQQSLFTPKAIAQLQPALKDNDLISILSCTSFHNPVIKKSIHYLKYKNIPQIATPLGAIMVKTFVHHLQLKRNITICPIPLHPNRLKFRGYNQSLLLAQYLKAHLRFPLYLDLYRIRDTPHQMRILNREERVGNMHNAFQAEAKPQHQTPIVLIDDVTTTLSTITQAAKALRKQGFRDIHALILAH